VSLWFGRNEENGIRCPYHGWKFDVTGQCTEIPSEPPGSTHCQRIRMVNYPLIERGGILWTYMGPPDRQPPLPEWEFAMVPDGGRFVSKRWQECNWLQALEGGIDSSHVSFLHRGDLETDPIFKGSKGNRYNMGDLMPVFDVVESPGGLYIGARRNAEDGKYYWRITQWVMPCFTMIPPRGDHPVHGHFFIPIDDENTWAWSFDYLADRPLTDEQVQAMREGKGIHTIVDPNTFRPLANKDNDYLMDRKAQKAGRTYGGIAGFAMQDASIQESMGPIVDRSRENLVGTDKGIVMARRRLLRAAKALAEQGTAPPGVEVSHQRVRSASVVLPPDQPFAMAVGDALAARSGAAHASV
jgi:phenylpropionate dioxygenase-like ring-hydroxylating dioxygenase large terminal subunit